MVLAFGSVSLKFIHVGNIGRRVSITEVYSGRWYYRCGTVPLKYYSGRWLWHMGHCHWSSNDLILGQRALMTDSAVRNSNLEQTVYSINKLNCIMNMIILITACWLAAMIVMLLDICLCLYVLAIIWYWNWMNGFCIIMIQSMIMDMYVCMYVYEHDSVLFTWVCGSYLATFFLKKRLLGAGYRFWGLVLVVWLTSSILILHAHSTSVALYSAFWHVWTS